MHISQELYSSQNQQTPATQLTVIGKIPDYINGTFIRNGPALFETGETKLKHWFDGYGLLHAFTMKNGDVTYLSRFVDSPEYKVNTSTHSNSAIMWGTPSDPCQSIFKRFMSSFISPTNTPVNIVKIDQKYYATSDISSANEIDPETLETVSTIVGGQSVMAAHPGFSRDGSVWNMESALSPVVHHSVVKLDQNYNKNVVADFKSKRTYYFHSFANTDRYFVSIEQPMYLSFLDLVTASLRNKSYSESYKWDKEAHNILHIYDKKNDQMIHIPTKESFFYFHTINTFEKDGILNIDLCAYKNNDIINDFYLDNLKSKGVNAENKASLLRLMVDIDSSSVKSQWHDINIELPTINFAYSEVEHRFTYGVQSSAGSAYLADTIIKIDHKDMSVQSWAQDGVIPSEPFFVADGGEQEDDGSILTICFEIETKKSFLLVLDAQTLQEKGRVYTPRFIPSSLHGCFYPSSLS